MKTALLLVMLPFAAHAGGEYARQWPLQLGAANAGAYRVELDDAVYRQARSRALADVDVVDAQGRPVPTALFGPDNPGPQAATFLELPWFPLPTGDRDGSDIASISEVATDGSLRRVEWRTGGGGSVAGNGFLLDASNVTVPIQALRVRWASGQAAFDLPVRVSASDDLRDWRIVADGAHLVELSNAGQRILRDRIDIGGTKARYLRVAPLDADAMALEVSGVVAELQTPAAAPKWQWRALRGTRVQDADASVHYEFELDGRFPVAQADVVLPGNSTGQWRLQVRDEASAPWRDAAMSWMAFRLEQDGRTDASPPQPLYGIHRELLWRLTPVGAASHADAPQLRLGYRPESLVFVAQGTGPFALVAGSARTSRADAELTGLIEAMRTQHGAQWQPAVATLGASAERAGQVALTPAPAPRDWKTWLLWSVLVLGVVVVGGFALSLLRRPTA